MMTPVVTRSYDNVRSGTNYSETILTAANVRQRGIVRLYSIPLPGDDRGTEAQPLIAPNILCADGFRHDLLIVPTMANTVYAFDANATTPTLVWAQRLGNPIAGSYKIDGWRINSHWGILSTPVLDLENGVLYAVAYSSPDGSYEKGAFLLHACHLSDGSAACPSLDLEQAVDAPGHGITPNRFSGVQRKQRAGLLLGVVNGRKTLFIGAGSIFESLASNLGWLIAVDLAHFSITAALTACPRLGGGGIWMGSQGPAMDRAGNIYFVTGNGHFDAITEFGECICRAKYDYSAGTLKIDDWFSPFSDAQRDGQDPPAGLPTNMNGWDDQDLGSAGALLIESLGFVIASGKDGISYITRTAAMGKTTPAQQKAGQHYAQLAWPPEWLTYYPGPDVSPMPVNPTDLNFNFAGVTHHMHSTPVHYMPEGLDGRHLIYCWGENGQLRAWNLTATGELQYRGAGAETASWLQPGMPGGMISASAHGADPDSGIIWGLSPARDANRVISPGRLTAHSATNLIRQADGSMQMETLWDSTRWNVGFTHNKFDIVTVSGGRLFVPTYSATIDLYGLTP